MITIRLRQDPQLCIQLGIVSYSMMSSIFILYIFFTFSRRNHWQTSSFIAILCPPSPFSFAVSSLRLCIGFTFLVFHCFLYQYSVLTCSLILCYMLSISLLY